MAAIRNVVFDIGGALLNWDPWRLLAQLYPDASVRARVMHAVFEHPDWLALDRGTLSAEDAVRVFSERSGRPVAEMQALMQAVPESLTPREETVALLEELAQRPVPLYCLSNMAASTWNYLRARDAFWQRFQGIVISAHVKLLKPERAIYEYLLQTHGLVPEQTVFIDDVAANVAAAREVGLHAIEFRGAADCRVQLERLLAG